MKTLFEFIFVVLFYYFFIKFIVYIIKKIKYNKFRNECFKEKREKKKSNTNDFFDIFKFFFLGNYKKININTIKRDVFDNSNNLKYRVVPNYRKRKNNSIMTETELKFYNVLYNIAVNNNLTVFSQVALNSIIDVNLTGNKSRDTTLNNKIQCKIIDFVVCSNTDNSIVLCIELDDYTHYLKERYKRDIFLDEIFEEVGIPLKHIKVHGFYDIYNLQKSLGIG